MKIYLILALCLLATNVFADIYVTGDAEIEDSLSVGGNQDISGSLSIGDTLKTDHLNSNSGSGIDLLDDLKINYLKFEDDSGAVTFLDMGVTSTPVAGIEESYSISIDSETIFTVYAEADGTGGIQSPAVKITGDAMIVGDSRSSYNILSMSEEVTIPVASGETTPVETTGNLAPANSLITGIAYRVTQAPGGGASLIDIGITGGDLDAYINDGKCDALDATGDFFSHGSVSAPIINRGVAKTLTLTTDSNVTISDMKIRVVVFYETITPPEE